MVEQTTSQLTHAEESVQTLQKVLEWTWNGRKTPLKDLSDSQLHSIKDTLVKSKNDWFGISKKQWLEEINPMIKQREKTNIVQISNEIFNRRIKNTTLRANYIVNNMIKSSNQTLSVKEIYKNEEKAVTN